MRRRNRKLSLVPPRPMRLPAKPPPTAPSTVAALRPLPLPTWLPSTPPATAPMIAPAVPWSAPWVTVRSIDSTVPHCVQRRKMPSRRISTLPLSWPAASTAGRRLVLEDCAAAPMEAKARAAARGRMRSCLVFIGFSRCSEARTVYSDQLNHRPGIVSIMCNLPAPSACQACFSKGVPMSLILVPVSYGELIDKITILEIKSKQMTDPAKLANVRNELDQLNTTWAAHPAAATDIADERPRLLGVNETLWDIEDRIRLKEKAQDYKAV